MRLQNLNIPKELICPICTKMLNNAVMLPCCGESACDDCVRGTLIDSSNFQCPLCKSPLVPDELVPNKALRRAVEAFNQSGGHTGATPPISPTFPAATIGKHWYITHAFVNDCMMKWQKVGFPFRRSNWIDDV